jgi:hypothetical protein
LLQKSVPGKEHLSDYTSESRSYLRLCDLPVEERPRERLYQVGERALSTTELLAIVIGSGHGNDNVLQLAQLLLSDSDGNIGAMVDEYDPEEEFVVLLLLPQNQARAYRIDIAVEKGLSAGESSVIEYAGT